MCVIGTALNNATFHSLLGSAQGLNHGLIGTHGLAREYSDSDVDRMFRVNGLATPSDARYSGLLKRDFGNYALVVDGAVENKQALSLAVLSAMPSRSQITRHDCVEGWSAIGNGAVCVW